jgi:hypothetical protein
MSFVLGKGGEYRLYLSFIDVGEWKEKVSLAVG